MFVASTVAYKFMLLMQQNWRKIRNEKIHSNLVDGMYISVCRVSRDLTCFQELDFRGYLMLG